MFDGGNPDRKFEYSKIMKLSECGGVFLYATKHTSFENEKSVVKECSSSTKYSHTFSIFKKVVD